MIRSMTGFATLNGQGAEFSWVWDLRSVNAKGLDLRLRVPDWITGLDPALRAALTRSATRGAVSLSLRLLRDAGAGGAALNAVLLDQVMAALVQIEVRAHATGASVGPASSAEILNLRGMFDASEPDADSGALLAVLLADIPALLAAFDAARTAEGAALAAVLTRQIDAIAALTAAADMAASARAPEAERGLIAAVARVLAVTDAVDPARLAQELALIAVKTDVTEEIDRLSAHVGQARALLAGGDPVGRRLDFLMQEFNREANTLCSKSQSTELTRIGLDLKTVIDQMREQVQNVE
jgi:uncharacterized protein (TIGR00255 family)